MAFDGIGKTEEPKVPEGMTAIRIVVGYTQYGNPVAMACTANWTIIGLREKCEREHQYEDDEEDEEPDNSDRIPVSHVQRIIMYVPSMPPAAKVAKALDLSALMNSEEEPLHIEMVAPDSDEPERKLYKSAWD